MTATIEQGSLEDLNTNVVDEVLNSIESKLLIDEVSTETKSIDVEATSESIVTATNTNPTIVSNNESIDKNANTGVDVNGVGLDAKQKKKYDKLAGMFILVLVVKI
jgi:hypothetical protein